MIILVGWARSETPIGRGPEVTCPRCGHSGAWLVFEKKTGPTLYFLRLGSRKTWAAACPVCYCGAEVHSSEDRDRLLRADPRDSAWLADLIRSAETTSSQPEWGRPNR